MRIDLIHYTTIGLAIQPPEADREGFLIIRSGFENFPDDRLSKPERVVRDQVKRIEAWRDCDDEVSCMDKADTEKEK